jgi:hypothetical protein
VLRRSRREGTTLASAAPIDQLITMAESAREPA